MKAYIERSLIEDTKEVEALRMQAQDLERELTSAHRQFRDLDSQHRDLLGSVAKAEKEVSRLDFQTFHEAYHGEAWERYSSAKREREQILESVQQTLQVWEKKNLNTLKRFSERVEQIPVELSLLKQNLAEYKEKERMKAYMPRDLLGNAEKVGSLISLTKVLEGKIKDCERGIYSEMTARGPLIANMRIAEKELTQLHPALRDKKKELENELKRLKGKLQSIDKKIEELTSLKETKQEDLKRIRLELSKFVAIEIEDI